jgi:hypothetical protein
MREELELTAEETEIVMLLGEAWNKFCKLPNPEAIGTDATEFMQTIHSAQGQILMRSGRRQLYYNARK